MERFAQPNPASKYPRLDVRLLQNETILLMLKNQRTRQIIDQYLHQQGVVLENILHTSNIPAIMELISVGYGVSFLFEPHILHHNFRNPISCFSFGEPRTTSALVVATRKTVISHLLPMILLNWPNAFISIYSLPPTVFYFLAGAGN